MKTLQRSRKIVVLLVNLAIWPMSYAAAQNDTVVDSAMAEFRLFSDSIFSANEETLVEPILEYRIAFYKYHTESLSNRKIAFGWSHTSSVIIFWMVLIIVIFGLILCTIQFYISMLNAKYQLGKEEKNIGVGEPKVTGLKIALSGLEVNSSVLGIIILVISLAFFYLYLIYVYPVKEFNIEVRTPQESTLSP